jgi:hypothetical protein
MRQHHYRYTAYAYVKNSLHTLWLLLAAPASTAAVIDALCSACVGLLDSSQELTQFYY